MAGSIGPISFTEPQANVFLAGSGLSTPSSNESDVSVGTSAVETTARNLHVTILGSASPTGHIVEFILFVEGFPTGLKCALFTGVSTTCSDTTDTASIPAGTTVSLDVFNNTVVGNAATTLPRVLFGYEAG
jgi:hypothetical protein